MVKLNKIYTRGGDKGETSLGDGMRVRKHALRVAAYGEVDEANCVLGSAIVSLKEQNSDCPMASSLRRIQNDLFDLGADLCVPQKPNEAENSALRITSDQVKYLEGEIDRLNADLTPLNSFILPGGSRAAADLHLARAVARRAERKVTALAEQEDVNPEAIAYINRLSDLLFVMARSANGDNGDVLWQPGGTR